MYMFRLPNLYSSVLIGSQLLPSMILLNVSTSLSVNDSFVKFAICGPEFY